jgi:hypothetical protein
MKILKGAGAMPAPFIFQNPENQVSHATKGKYLKLGKQG